MQKILAHELMFAMAQLERVQVVIEQRKKGDDWDAGEDVAQKIRTHISMRYSELATVAKAMGAMVTSGSARMAVRRLRARKKPITYAEMGELTAQIRNVLQIELGGIELFCLNPGASGFYSPADPLFGDSVELQIPKASDDISEAGKCFATGRYTASVFHMMRAMEAAVQAISERLGIENIEREWGKLLSDLAEKIGPMPKGSERNDWSEIHANLYHVKQAWRNETMHPKATYTDEEAREVFDAMKALMRKLADLITPVIGKEPN